MGYDVNTNRVDGAPTRDTPNTAPNLRRGVVMRCCVETLGEREAPGRDGDVLPCRYCSSRLIFRSGAWELDYGAIKP